MVRGVTGWSIRVAAPSALGCNPHTVNENFKCPGVSRHRDNVHGDATGSLG